MNEILKKIDEEIERLNNKRNELYQARKYQVCGIYFNKIAEASKIKSIILSEQKDKCYCTEDCEMEENILCNLYGPCPHQYKPKTKGDVIRESNFKLANTIHQVTDCKKCPAKDGCEETNQFACYSRWFVYLNQPLESEEV